MSSKEKIKSLLELAHALGREELGLAILGEGNVSCRLDAKRMLIKASGTCLAALTKDELVECRISDLIEMIETPLDLTDDQVESRMLNSKSKASKLKPSVEAMFHAFLLSQPGIDFVAHTHPLSVNSILCSCDKLGQKFAFERRFPDEIVYCGAKSLWLPYVDPGLILSREIAGAYKDFVESESSQPKVILMHNHGLITVGSSDVGALASTRMCDKAARIFAASIGMGGSNALTPDQTHRINTRQDEKYRQQFLIKKNA